MDIVFVYFTERSNGNEKKKLVIYSIYPSFDCRHCTQYIDKIVRLTTSLFFIICLNQ